MVPSSPQGFLFVALFAVAAAALPAQGKTADVKGMLARIGATTGAERDAAIQDLAAMGAKAVPVLRRVLEEGDDAQRICALLGIAKMGKAAEPLTPAISKLWMMEHIPVSQAIHACFVGLGAVGVPELTRCVADFGLQAPACAALAEIGPAGKPAVPALGKLLSTRTHGAHLAASPLGAIGDPAAIPFLVKVIAEGADNPRGCDSAKVANSAQALARFGAQGAAAVPHLVKVMQAEASGFDVVMLDKAASALGDIGVCTEPVLVALRKVAANASGQLKTAAADSLEVLECAATASDGAVARAIRHSNPELRLHGLQRAVERAANGTALVPAIVWSYEHTDDVRVRMAAVAALGAIGVQDEHVTRVLEAACRHADAKLAAAAQEVRARLARKS
ncbi:MAG: hypothetical protein JNK15_19380 [Planctomycetes bacterium]|nr:hypothetical protein [Planctomycetota bacterium]